MFVEQINAVTAKVVEVNGDGEWTKGFESLQDLMKLPEEYNAYI